MKLSVNQVTGCTDYTCCITEPVVVIIYFSDQVSASFEDRQVVLAKTPGDLNTTL